MVNSNKFIRNVHLHVLTDLKLEEPYVSIFNQFESLFEDIKIYKGFNIGLLTYYVGKSKDDIYFEYNPDSGILVAQYDLMYEVFANKYPISPFHLKKITEWYIIYKFGLKKYSDIWYGYPAIDSEDEYFEVEHI